MSHTQLRLAGIAAIALLVSIFLPRSAAQADIAPPETAPGSNIQPQEATQVQMKAERVVIEVLRVKGSQSAGLPVANVTATFTMHNTGNAVEAMTVRFPLSDPSGRGDGFGGHPEIEQVAVTVNGRRVPTRIVTTPNPSDSREPSVKWAAFDVTFPPGKDVEIGVEYILQSSGYMPYGRFKYILETGAGWAGPIGTAEFILKLPYAANDQNVVLGQSTPGGTFTDGEVRWRFTDIEPSEKDNFYVTVMAPSVWQRILEARRQTEAKPTDAAAWRELAQAYASAIFSKYGPEIGENFVPLIEEAYAQAQKNDPSSAQLHAELAQVLLSLYPPLFEVDPTIIEKVLAALKSAFERDPNNPLAQKVASELRDWFRPLVESAGPAAEAARKYLEQLTQITRETGADRFAATPTATVTRPAAPEPTAAPPLADTPQPTATPSAPGTPEAPSTPISEVLLLDTEPVVSSSIVTTTTEAGAVITSTVISTATTTLTDTATSRPVVIVTIKESRIVTETADVAGTIPATVTEVSTTTTVTTTAGSEAAPAASTVITATATMTITTALDETGAVKPEASSAITTTTVTTATAEASPLEPTQPATVTVIVAQTTISPTIIVTRPAETGESSAIEASVTESIVVTTTTGVAEPGAPPITSIITETNVITTTVEPPRTEGTPPIISVITGTTVVTATVDASGIVTPGTPIIVVVTGTLPGPAPEAAVGVTPEATATQTAVPTSEVTAATPEATTVEPAATATAAIAIETSAGEGMAPAAWLALLLTYAAGGAAVYGVHSAIIERDRKHAAAAAAEGERPESAESETGV